MRLLDVAVVVKQLAAGCDNEQNEIVAIAGEIEVEQSQQRRNLGYRPTNDVALLHELWLLLFNGLTQKPLFDRNGKGSLITSLSKEVPQCFMMWLLLGTESHSHLDQ